MENKSDEEMPSTDGQDSPRLPEICFFDQGWIVLHLRASLSSCNGHSYMSQKKYIYRKVCGTSVLSVIGPKMPYKEASPWYERTKEGTGMAEKRITPTCVLGAKRSKVGNIPTTFNMC